jgi:peptidoglycan/LPS O-acetylase OafA/YrhL
LDLLLLLRGLAAVSVVVWHLEGYKSSISPVLNTPGRTAVWLFFGISGYVIAHGFVHRKYRLTVPDLRNFFINRLLRIYPLFLLLSLLALVTLWVQHGRSPLTVADIPAQFFGVQFNQRYVLSGVFWTLGIELQFYALAPLLAVPLLLEPRGRMVLLAALYTAMTCGYWYAVARHDWSADGRNIIANLPHFFVGMLACRLTADLRVLPPAWLSLGAALGLVGLTNWLYQARGPLFWSSPGMLLVDAAILFFALAHGRLRARPAPTNLGVRMLAWLGVLSYGVYAWHAYLPMVIPEVLDHLPVLLCLSIAAAYGSFRLVEAPVLRLKQYASTRGCLGPSRAVGHTVG